jgi:hypothetical protein
VSAAVFVTVPFNKTLATTRACRAPQAVSKLVHITATIAVEQEDSHSKLVCFNATIAVA